MLAVHLDVAEAVRAEASTGMDRDAIADPRSAIDRDRRVQLHTAADLHTGPNDAVRPNHRPVADAD